ncbi:MULTISPECIES: hypothetical protein [unclassified Kribbella]|uniref:hypothetical protein n=1 Tax=unclassified Kribbella TaxID=2644121 RepID=UPI0033D2AA30
MGTTGGAKGGGRSGPPTPAVVGTGRSMRARDVSRRRQPVNRRPVLPPAADDKDHGDDKDQDSGGSSPVDS